MALTNAQLQTLRTAINNNATWNQWRIDTNYSAIYNALNTNRSPDYWVWRTSVSKSELTNSTSIDGTVFNWTGTGFITRAQGERDAWVELFDSSGNVNASLAQVRQAFQDIFSGGTAPAPANRTHLATVARRKATEFEFIFATGAGTTAAPSTMGVEGPVSFNDVVTACQL